MRFRALLLVGELGQKHGPRRVRRLAVQARSRPSLITGLASAVVALVALWFSTLRSPFGFPLGMTLAVVLFVFFGYRYALRNRQFMPSGMMAVVSLVVLGVMFMVLDWSR